MDVPHRTSSMSADGESPHGSDDHGSVEHSPSKSLAATRRGFPDVCSSGSFSERAESEAPTADPIVDPEQFGPRRRRRGSSSASHGPVHAPPDRLRGSPDSNAQLQGDGNAELLNVMKQLLSDQKKRYDGSESSWTSARGPAPGVRWRGGTAPTPPTWQYQQNDLRAFSKFEGKVQAWVLQSELHDIQRDGVGLVCLATGRGRV